MPEPTPLEIKVTREFQRKARFLAKKYRHIQTDLEPILEKLRLGETLGDIILMLEGTPACQRKDGYKNRI